MSNQSNGKYATFFINTGRCGTQWFTDKLQQHYGTIAVVHHEHLNEDYDARRYFNAYKSDEDIPLTSALNEHFEFIERTLETKHYIEVGWSTYGILPLLLVRFAGKVKIVHLYRHPINVAASLVTHRVYRRGRWTEKLAISPTDYGVVQGELKSKWKRLSDFEKCLFWWTEINAHALHLKAQFPQVPWLSIKFEDIFHDADAIALRKLLNFLNFPEKELFLMSRSKKTDNSHLKIYASFNINAIKKYPATLNLMNVFDYDYDPSQIKSLRRRYNLSVFSKIKQKLFSYVLKN